MNTTRDLSREIEAATVLREQLRALGEQDEDLARDMIEGETNLVEMIGRMVAQDGEDAAHVAGLKAYADEIAKRKARIETRIELRRTLLAKALEMAGHSKLETSTGTLSLSASPQTAIIRDESAIPSHFWIATAPKLDKRGLLRALHEREAMISVAAEIEDPEARRHRLALIPAIPGAELSNGGVRLTIRRS